MRECVHVFVYHACLISAGAGRADNMLILRVQCYVSKYIYICKGKIVLSLNGKFMDITSISPKQTLEYTHASAKKCKHE